jgi:hypothetical protein
MSRSPKSDGRGQGGELGTSSLSESSGTIGGGGCMILGGMYEREIHLASKVKRKKLWIDLWLLLWI